jgi:hypothetical protein
MKNLYKNYIPRRIEKFLNDNPDLEIEYMYDLEE